MRMARCFWKMRVRGKIGASKARTCGRCSLSMCASHFSKATNIGPYSSLCGCRGACQVSVTGFALRCAKNAQPTWVERSSASRRTALKRLWRCEPTHAERAEKLVGAHRTEADRPRDAFTIERDPAIGLLVGESRGFGLAVVARRMEMASLAHGLCLPEALLVLLLAGVVAGAEGCE